MHHASDDSGLYSLACRFVCAFDQLSIHSPARLALSVQLDMSSSSGIEEPTNAYVERGVKFGLPPRMNSESRRGKRPCEF